MQPSLARGGEGRSPILDDMSDRPLLVIEHEASCPPGWMGQWWHERGLTLDIRRPYLALEQDRQGLPDDLTGHSGLCVLGGEMGANDDADFAWLSTTKDLVRQAAQAQLPTLGICLGHQLIAVALGGTVIRNPNGHATGLTPVALTEAGGTDPLLASASSSAVAVQWNHDVVVELPPEAVSLATAPDGTVQAARFGPQMWGVQFHPEATPEIFDAWTVDKPSAKIPREDGIDVFAAAAEIRAASGDLQRDWRVLADRFATRLVDERAA